VTFLGFFTVGFNYYVGYVLEIYVSNDIETLKSPSAKEYYKIIFMETGTMHILLNKNEYILTGTNTLCLNEKDDLYVFDLSDKVITILFFNPLVINNKFNFDIFNYPDLLSPTELQDLCYLTPFSYNSKLPSKFLQHNAIDSSVIKQKLQLLNEQLSLQNNYIWPCRSRSYLFEILFSLVRPFENENSILLNRLGSNFSKLTIDIVCYLQNSYNQKITIETLSQLFHSNRTTLLADFKKSTGQSINSYLTQLRMIMATTLLRDTELTVCEICERTGFSDISYFSKLFKRKIQFTPSEYRRINVCKSFKY